jgi:hypothetical protein
MVLYAYTMCNAIELLPKSKNVGSNQSIPSGRSWRVGSWSFAMLTSKVAFSESRCSRSTHVHARPQLLLCMIWHLEIVTREPTAFPWPVRRTSRFSLSRTWNQSSIVFFLKTFLKQKVWESLSTHALSRPPLVVEEFCVVKLMGPGVSAFVWRLWTCRSLT